MLRLILCVVSLHSLLAVVTHAADSPLRVAAFQADITPPIGAPLCDALVVPAQNIVDHLSARGIVILSNEPPVVMCALDWVGVGNSGHDAFREALAKAAGTSRDRVAVHSLHQHDAPGCDFAADELLVPHGLGSKLFDVAFARTAIQRVADAAAAAVKTPQNVTHIGIGRGKVEQVASNRRVMGPDGKVKYVRYSAAKDEKVRAEPEGVIDPFVQLLSFWDGDRPLVSMTYYAVHPQSYYGKGGVSYDFPGMARALREVAVPNIAHIHFNGAGGNVTAGKYNDGAPENREVLAQRLAAGMKTAWDATQKTPVTGANVSWRAYPVHMPISPLYEDLDKLRATVADDKAVTLDRLRAARSLSFALRCRAGERVEVGRLKIGPAYVLHMPGELFIEYQLAAQKMRPDAPVMMAAYGDYGAGYIGTAISYTQGGYETGPVSRVAPEVEDLLLNAMSAMLK